MFKTAVRNLLLKQFEKRGYNIRFGAPRLDFEALVSDLIASRKDVQFLQIGGFDGVSDDPIHRFVTGHKWSGIIVEPQPFYFKKLQETYAASPGVRVVNALIAEQSGPATFYTVSKELPMEYHGQASFDKELILKHLYKLPNPEKFIIEQQLPATTLPALLQANPIGRVDLLQIDTEGFDYDVLKQFDFTAGTPALVHFEHIHLKPEKLKGAVDLLVGKGYRLLVDDIDITAFK